MSDSPKSNNDWLNERSVQDLILNTNIKKQIIENGTLSNQFNATDDTEKIKTEFLPVNHAITDFAELVAQRRKLFDKLMCDRLRLSELLKQYQQRKISLKNNLKENETDKKINSLMNQINYIRKMSLILFAVLKTDDTEIAGMNLLNVCEKLTGDRTVPLVDEMV